MQRSFWIKAHLIAAAFFTPALLLIAVSGGLYLIGIKGSVTQTPVDTPAGLTLNAQSDTLEADIRQVLQSVDADFDFEYLKIDGDTLITRPTSRPFYEIDVLPGGLNITHNRPSLQKTMIELHKGHGPLMFKDFQKALAAALLFILLSGTWLGLSSSGLRLTTVAASGSGLAVLLALILAP